MARQDVDSRRQNAIDRRHQSKGRTAIRKILMTGLRLFITAGLAALLFARLDIGRTAELMLRASLPLVAAALIAILIATLVMAVRWHLILSAAATSPGPVGLIKIVFVGLFFNQVLPTGIGGDAVRAWRCRRIGIGLGAAIRSILLDRACGYCVLVAAYAAALPGLLRLMPLPSERIGMMAVFVAAVMGLVGLVSIDHLPAPLLRLRAVAPLAELSRESRRLLRDGKRCAAVMGLSLLTIGFSILAFQLAGDAVGSRLSFAVWAMVVPPVSFLQLLPVSLAGWGVREASLVVVLGAYGVPAEAALAISILSGFCLVVLGVPGGLIWFTDWDLTRVQPAPADVQPG
jgi:glycosyltransferase 2 family protein